MLLANSAIDKATHMMKITLSSQPHVFAAGPATQRFSQHLCTQSVGTVCSCVTVADAIPHCRGNTRKQTHDREADGKRRPGREFTLELLLVAQGCQRRLVLGHLVNVIRLVARRQRGGDRRRMVRFRHGFGKASRLGSIYTPYAPIRTFVDGRHSVVGSARTSTAIMIISTREGELNDQR